MRRWKKSLGISVPARRRTYRLHDNAMVGLAKPVETTDRPVTVADRLVRQRGRLGEVRGLPSPQKSGTAAPGDAAARREIIEFSATAGCPGPIGGGFFAQNSLLFSIHGGSVY